MTPKTDATNPVPANPFPGPASADIRCKQDREEALEWVSHNALSTVRNTWCKARSYDRRTK